MKKVLLALLAVLPLAYAFHAPDAPTPLQAAEQIEVRLFGEPVSLEVSPRLVDGVTLVPLRSLAEAMGAEVVWNEDTQTATWTKGDDTIQMTVGEARMLRNGSDRPMEAAARMIDGTMMVPVRAIGESFDTKIRWDGSARTVHIDKLEQLPVLGSFDKLVEIAQTANQASDAPGRISIEAIDQIGINSDASFTADTAANTAPAAEAKASAKSVSGTAGTDFSGTNVQVEGVDEADIVKTDGQFMYQVNRNKIIVAEVQPADQMRIVSTLDFANGDFRPQELYIDDQYMVVIGSSNIRAVTDVRPMVNVEAKKIAVIDQGKQYTAAWVYDISDKTNIHRVREVELEGRYVSSRKIGSALYLITNKQLNYYSILKEKAENDDYIPTFRDSAAGDEYRDILYDKIAYFPESNDRNYMLIAGFDLERPDRHASVSAYLGSGQNIYASDKHLYVTVSRTEWIPTIQDTAAPASRDAASESVDLIAPAPPATETKSIVYKFRLDQGKTQYLGQGEVPGRILNQFSMDEHESYFRIATTTGEIWRTDEFTSKNNIYVLDESLKIVGKIEDIAPGEQIYSARFMGKRAYMVTFRTVDPLFAIDLSHPESPRILGKLKIPGYSDYLHPYDEHHLIGFGKDTVETSSQQPGGGGQPIAYYTGMKIALFDITNVEQPVEKFKEIIGDRGTHSELLQNHKALLFSREKNLLAFPVTVMESSPSGSEETASKMPAYGEFAFQGAYVYDVDLQSGFRLRGKITHLSDEDYAKSGNGWYHNRLNIQRILYIDDTLYTLSSGKIKANDLSSLQERGSLIIPE